MKQARSGLGGWLALGVCLVVLAASCGCEPTEESAAPPVDRQAPPAVKATPPAAPETAPSEEPAAAAPEQAATAAAASASKLVARMETTMGTIVLQLAEDKAPNTVANFVHLASIGFYDGIIFHRLVGGFVIQGGCPDGTGMGGPGWRIKDEFHPDLRHDRAGVLSMANSGPDTGGSQFFITLGPTLFLDNKHAVFGQVIEGMDVVEAIAALRVGANDRPLEPPKIERIVLTRDGVELTGEQPKPETLPDPRARRGGRGRR